MYSTKLFALLFVLSTFLGACGWFARPDVEPCEWNASATYHAISVPLDIIPHKRTYKVGDTILFSLNETEMLYDSALGRRFDLGDFPFRPVHVMWRFDFSPENDTIYFPYAQSPFEIDEKYRPERVGTSRELGYRMWATNENGYLRTDVKMVLSKPGRYISSWYDVYEATNPAGGGDRSYAEPIVFEDQCDIGFIILNVIRGEDHLESYERELMKIDSLFRGKYTDLRPDHESLYGDGIWAFSHKGYFGFDVVE